MTEPVKAPALPPTHACFTLAEAARLVYRANVPPNVPMARLLDPDYWAHVTPKLKPGFLIEALAQDGRWFAEFLVRKVDLEKHEVHCVLLRSNDFDSVPKTQDAAGYIVNFGGAHKWRIVRESDKQVIHHGEPSEADAKEWLADFLAGKVTA